MGGRRSHCGITSGASAIGPSGLGNPASSYVRYLNCNGEPIVDVVLLRLNQSKTTFRVTVP
jgi:hypothetical protein